MKTTLKNNLMKKTMLLLFLTFTFLSCEKDEVVKEVPGTNVMKVLAMQSGGTPTIRTITYGTSQDDKVTTEVTLEVYNYYNSQVTINGINTRWKGEVTN